MKRKNGLHGVFQRETARRMPKRQPALVDL
jgi:hypothetical protein